MKQHIRKLIVDALRANPRKGTGEMRKNSGGRCCLCVAQDAYCDKYEPDKKFDHTQQNRNAINLNCGLYNEIGSDPKLPVVYVDSGYAGLSYDNASNVNDGGGIFGERGLTHKRIAECFSNYGKKQENMVFTFYMEANRTTPVDLPRPMTLNQIKKYIKP